MRDGVDAKTKRLISVRLPCTTSQAQTCNGYVQPPGKAAHPVAVVTVQLRARVAEPGRRQPVAFAARSESATAILGVRGQLFLAIAHHDADAGIAHQIDAGLGIAAIGHHVTGADHAMPGNAAPPRLGQNRLGRLQIGIRAAKNQKRVFCIHAVTDPSGRHRWFAGRAAKVTPKFQISAQAVGLRQHGVTEPCLLGCTEVPICRERQSNRL